MSDPTTVAPTKIPAKPAIRPRVLFGLSVLGALLLMMVAAHVTFGSIPVAIRYARGERLILTPTDLRVEGLSRAGSVIVKAEVRNFGSTPVRLLGSAVNCACVTVKEMPDLIPAGGRSEIVFDVHALPKKPDVDQLVVFFTDHSSRPRLSVHITGKVRD